MLRFDAIQSRNHLADFLGIPRSKLTHILYVEKVDNLYSSFEVPKKSGGTREINAPDEDLKSIQRRLANALYEYYYDVARNEKRKTNISHAFEKRKNIITNAEIHRNKKYILNIDLENFFDSFHFGRVKGYFEKNKDFNFSREVAVVLAQLTCYRGRLPQGAPTSPIITNLICNILDMRLLRTAKKYKLDYTRYADDLSFSTNDKSFAQNKDVFLKEIEREIQHAGFTINQNKTRFMHKDSRQEVTGLVVNQKINVNRRYCKSTRAMADSLYKTGTFKVDGEEGTVNQLEGRFAFINQLDYYNNKKKEKGSKKRNYADFTTREKQYQKFLFYKYFFGNDKPLIVTEGKTDILYIKSALKKYHDKYPELISKDENGRFNFRVSFLRKTERLSYFFNLKEDGADTMQNIYVLFKGMNGMPDYPEILKKKRDGKPDNPTILVFDNEMEGQNGDKPLKKFVKKVACLKDDEIEVVKEKLYYQLIENLFLVTNPLVKEKRECEIEDLFDEGILEHQINGKRFSRESKWDHNIEYGKADFAKYIAGNYEAINFDRFIPMIDAIDAIVKEYREMKKDTAFVLED